MTRIIIADDHPIVREGLKKILEKTNDILVAGEAGTGEELLGLVRESDCDIVLLDITMPGRGGLEILEQLRAEKPGVKVLVLSVHPEEYYAVRVLKAGASGYLNKEKAPAELIKAIRKVALGGKYVSPALAEMLAFELETGRDRTPHELLSNREFQVMCLIASGKTVSQVAAELSLSVRTISTYRSRILEKMKMKSNAELTRYAIKNQLVD
ncbi:MAG: response regulator transcription factor [Candidatus Glassbacteria bacterium]|nr:response regulator transcription factor [Candidatus Glassbacteria bacterium]